jgi:hypothetical protein
MTCDLCGKFKSQSNARLWKHMSRHVFLRNEKNKKFFCEYCGYTCFFKSRLDKHLWTHGINLDVKEVQDEKTYVERMDLMQHKKFKHEGVVQPYKFLCKIFEAFGNEKSFEER